MICPNCGAQIPDGSTTCPNCGATLQALPVYRAPPDNEPRAYGAVQTPHKSNTKKIIIVVTVAAILLVSALAAVLLMSGGNERTMTYKEFLDQYDHDGDGRPESKTPKDFQAGDKVLIKDFAVNVTYNSSYDMSFIVCKSAKDYYEARGDDVLPMIAEGDMRQYTGRDFTYEYTFKKYTDNGETYIMPRELYLLVAPHMGSSASTPIAGTLVYVSEVSDPINGNASFELVLGSPNEVETSNVTIRVIDSNGMLVDGATINILHIASDTEHMKSVDRIQISYPGHDIRGYQVVMIVEGWEGTIEGNVPS